MRSELVLAISVVTNGFCYAALGAGLLLGQRVTGVVNLAYGDLAVAAVMVFSLLVPVTGTAWAAVVASLVGGVSPILLDVFVVQPMGDVRSVNASRHHAALAATLGVSIALSNSLALAAGAYPRRVGLPSSTGSVDVLYLGVACVQAALMAYMVKFLPVSRMAIAMGSSPMLARGSILPVMRIRLWTLFTGGVGALLATLILHFGIGAVSPFGGVAIMFRALAVMIAASTVRVRRLFAAGLLLAAGETAAGLISATWHDLVPFVAVCALVIVRMMGHQPRRV